MEVWKDIKGFENMYQVSNLGNVKSLVRKGCRKERILNPAPNSNGYLGVPLHKDGKQTTKMIHKLVAIAFLGHEPDGMTICVDHIDNNKLNNASTNLQLVSQRHNTSKDKFRQNYTSQFVGVSWYKPSKNWSAKIRINGKSKHLGRFNNEIDASKAYQKALKQLNK